MNDPFFYVTALLFGTLSFLSPCVLPLVPAYLSYLAGNRAALLTSSASGNDDVDASVQRRLKSQLMLSATAFVGGFSLVFVVLGATATALTNLFLSNIIWLSQISGVFICLMALHYIGLFRIKILMRTARFEGPEIATGPIGGLLMGISFGFAWTPCIGPILGTILAVASRGDTAMQGVALLSIYAAGLAIPFMLSALFVERMSRQLSLIKPHLRKIELITGTLLLLTGALMISGDFAAIGNWMIFAFPALGQLG